MAATWIDELPETIETEEELDEVMTRPRPALIEFVGGLSGRLIVLGASGKMGPTLAVLARRAAEAAGSNLEILAVARFTDTAARDWLEERGVRTLRCDLMERDDVAALPDVENVIYMAGRKFGTQSNPALTWAMNTLAPAYVAERFASSRIVAMSTGCVYPLVQVSGGGSVESDALTPIGEYANACVARERVFDHLAERNGTPLCHIRLNYAVDLRYGVLVDIAEKVLREEPIDLTMGHLNCIWQGDANDAIIRALAIASSPTRPLNLTGTEMLAVREIAARFGELMGKRVTFTGAESESALLSDTSTAVELLGAPPTPLDRVMTWTAHWLMGARRTLGKPTHFGVRDGGY